MQAHLRKKAESVRDKHTDAALRQNSSPIEDDIGWRDGSFPNTQLDCDPLQEHADYTCGGAKAGSSMLHGRKPVIKRTADWLKTQQQQHEDHRSTGV